MNWCIQIFFCTLLHACNVVLNFESVDEILSCDDSNETSSAVLLHGTILGSLSLRINSSFVALQRAGRDSMPRKRNGQKQPL